jgi:hypothetical protein
MIRGAVATNGERGIRWAARRDGEEIWEKVAKEVEVKEVQKVIKIRRKLSEKKEQVQNCLLGCTSM